MQYQHHLRTEKIGRRIHADACGASALASARRGQRGSSSSWRKDDDEREHIHGRLGGGSGLTASSFISSSISVELAWRSWTRIGAPPPPICVDVAPRRARTQHSRQQHTSARAAAQPSAAAAISAARSGQPPCASHAAIEPSSADGGGADPTGGGKYGVYGAPGDAARGGVLGTGRGSGTLGGAVVAGGSTASGDKGGARGCSAGSDGGWRGCDGGDEIGIGGGDGGGGDGAGTDSTATVGAAMLSTVMPRVDDRSDADVTCRAEAALLAAATLSMIRRTCTFTLAAVTVITTSSASENWLSSAARALATSKDETSPEAVKPTVTTDK